MASDPLTNSRPKLGKQGALLGSGGLFSWGRFMHKNWNVSSCYLQWEWAWPKEKAVPKVKRILKAAIVSLCEFTCRVQSKYRYVIGMRDTEALMASRQYSYHPACWLIIFVYPICCFAVAYISATISPKETFYPSWIKNLFYERSCDAVSDIVIRNPTGGEMQPRKRNSELHRCNVSTS